MRSMRVIGPRNDEALAPVEDAVEIKRRLAEANPAAYQPDLAMRLNNPSNQLADIGPRDEALAPIEEAVEIYQGLAAVQPSRPPRRAFGSRPSGDSSSPEGTTRSSAMGCILLVCRQCRGIGPVWVGQMPEIRASGRCR